ncbi:MAG: hypothetical protein M3406_00020 [Chloroflexota bacterium]|nr:hypothetical protein [Chloroflexota bacterium]
MPSYERTRRFERDWKALAESDRDRFRTVFRRFDADLVEGTLRSGLRVKRVGGTDSVFEMTWAPDGRATFEYGTPQGKGTHVILRRIGRHDVFRRP